ncbi:leukocyte surface antigen CD53-like isoform X2 [Seriola dumerili]|uniref:leukocyte surface antigen CD53-like isoform X2 n=1 Tax=Seriola dumerili TaxID=41447 RepID=UPI000BBE9354|nr:leukocyte surface antigen CD53-like isoform X2 [Seriola dumerili]
MAQGCLKCLKYTMCVANFLCFMCGAAVLGFGVYMTVNFKMAALTPTLASFNLANMLLISGIVITCVSFLGFLGALKENRCLLLTIATMVEDDLNKGLAKAKGTTGNSTRDVLNEWDLLQNNLECCGVNNRTDWGNNVPESCLVKPPKPSGPLYWEKGCLLTLQNFFEENFLHTGISVIILCIIEVLGMCFAMTLFCHISRSGLGYKL